MNAAIIVENRSLNNIDEIINNHSKFLKGWQVFRISDVEITNASHYNALLTSKEFWGKYHNYNKVLIFQHDSGILREGIEEFMDWDYVGAPWLENAPWARSDRKGGNGGISLRCPKKSLSLCRKFPYHPSMGNEDVYFVHHLEKVGGKVAPYEVCKRFGVETEFTLGTFSYHAIDKHLTSHQCQQIFNYDLMPS